MRHSTSYEELVDQVRKWQDKSLTHKARQLAAIAGLLDRWTKVALLLAPLLPFIQEDHRNQLFAGIEQFRGKVEELQESMNDIAQDDIELLMICMKMAQEWEKVRGASDE